MKRLSSIACLLIVVCGLAACGPSSLPGSSGPAAASASSAASGSGAVSARSPVVAGSFYPADPAELRRTVEGLLAGAVVSAAERGPLVGAVAPHAGYAFSGPVAACTYKLLKAEPVERIVVVAPSHQAMFDGFAVLDDAAYHTPLGDVPLDREGAAWLRAQSPRFRQLDEAFQKEHSMEVQLPFLQVVQPKARILPIVMGRQELAWCQTLALYLERLARTLPGRTLLVASSDLSHYHPYDEAVTIDARLAKQLESMDPEGVYRGGRTEEWEACGLGPVTAVMMACRVLGGRTVERLALKNSGDTSGEKAKVVGYGAWAFEAPAHSEPIRGSGTAAVPTTEAPASTRPHLTEAQLKFLLDLAQRSVDCAARAESTPPFTDGGPELNRPGGAFVTLTKRGELRGCIGQVEATQPLLETVMRVARLAALEDPRFPPVTPDEMKEIEVSVTVLGPMMPVEDPARIEVGRHGLMIVRGRSSGLLLPQVPVEWGWDRDTFLEQVCHKAGLPADAWRSGSLLMSFEGQIYPEKLVSRTTKAGASTPVTTAASGQPER